MRNVKRTDIPNSGMVKLMHQSFLTNLDDDLNSFKSRPENIGYLFKEILKNIGYCSFLPDHKEGLKVLIELAAEIGTANFISSTKMDIDFDIKYKDKIYPFSRKKMDTYTSVVFWWRAFHVSIIANRMDCIEILKQVPKEVLKTAQVKGNEVDFKMIEFYKGLFSKTINIGDKLIEVFEVLNSASEIPSYSQKFIDMIQVNELLIYKAIFSSDNSMFNNNLYKGLSDHKKYWDLPENELSGESFISYPLLSAIIVGINNRDLKLDINSDYIPDFLLYE